MPTKIVVILPKAADPDTVERTARNMEFVMAAQGIPGCSAVVLYA